jgi:hypothetical protein
MRPITAIHRILAVSVACLALGGCIVAPPPGPVVYRPGAVWVAPHCGPFRCWPGYWR